MAEKKKEEAEKADAAKAAPAKNADGKLIIWNVKTGQRVERWPVDGRAMLDSGEFTAEEPANAVNEPENPNATPTPAPIPPSAAGPFASPLPTTTPLGEPAVHTRAGEATRAQTGPGEPKRVPPKGK